MTGRVAFVGLGAMGGPMAANLLRAGVELTVFDVVPERGEALARHGAVVAATVADAVRGAAVVLLMLPAGEHVLDVTLGSGGALAALADDAILVDMSTIAPPESDRLAAACLARGVRFLDIPVGGLVSFAIAGTSTFLVGGDDEAAFAVVRPLLDIMGSTVIRCGGVGTGVRTKVVNNLQAMAIAQITAEALVLAARLGLDVETVRQANAASTATNGQMQVNFPSKALIGDVEPGFSINLAHKDLALATAAAAAVGVTLPVGTAARDAYEAARRGGYGGQDFSALLDHASEQAGIAPPRLRAQAPG